MISSLAFLLVVFLSDGAASMAVKGLRVHRLRLTFSATTYAFNSDSTLLMITSGEQDIRTFNNGSILLRISAVILIAVSSVSQKTKPLKIEFQQTDKSPKTNCLYESKCESASY